MADWVWPAEQTSYHQLFHGRGSASKSVLHILLLQYNDTGLLEAG
jgi:hypothetical protein